MPTQNSFNGGEISPQAYARVDIDKYLSSYKESRNFIPLVYGSITRRPGFQFIAEVKDSTKAVRVVTFEYSNTQAYVLEFGDLYIRVYKDGGQIAGGNLVTNGDMELDDNWTAVGGGTDSQDSTYSNDELYAWTFTPTAQYEGIQGDVYTTVTGVTYTVTVSLLPPAGVTSCRIRVRLGDDSDYLYDQDSTGLTAEEWNEITFDVTETDGGDGAYIQILSGTGITAGAHYVDSVSVVKDTVYEITTTYTEDEIFDIHFAQSADTLYIAHGSHAPATLVRNAHDDWTLSDMSWLDGPWLGQNDTVITIDLSDVTGAITATASAALFRSTDVGRLLTQMHTVVDDDIWGVATITGYTSATVVSVTVIRDFGAHTANVDWKLGAWSDSTSYPKRVTLDKDRLCWACSDDFPENIWMSKIGIYTDHGAGVDSTGIVQAVADDDALNLTLGSKKVSSIQWVDSLKNFILGTVSAEYWLSSASGTGAVTANSKQAVSGSYNGSSSITPVSVNNVIVYLSRGNQIVRELLYSFETDSFSGEELTLLAEHITKDYTIKEMAYQDSPFRTVWMCRTDGTLIGMTYDRIQKIVAFHLHTTQDGEFESVATISGEADDDELWVVVKRVVDGSVVRHVERMAPYFRDDDIAEAFLVDSGLTYDARQNIDSITHANPGVINLVAHGYSDGDRVMFRTVDAEISGEEDYDSLNYFEYLVANKEDDTFELVDEDDDAVDLTEYKQVKSATVGKMVTTVTGMDHLEGEEVIALADGMVEAEQEVVSGEITISGTGASVVHVGLPYTSYLRTLSPEEVGRDGETTQILDKIIKHVRFKLYKSVGFFFGSDEDNADLEYTVIDDNTPMSRPTPMVSGDTELLTFNGKLSSDVGVYIEQTDPVPLTISSIMCDITFEGED